MNRNTAAGSEDGHGGTTTPGSSGAGAAPSDHLLSNELRAILHGTQEATGHEFFQSLVQFIAQNLDMKIALVGEMEDPVRRIVRTVAYWCNGELAENFEYDLAGTPCNRVVGREPCCYPSGVAKLFPDDAWLQEHRIECYLGIPLFDSAGQPLGLFSVLGDRPLANANEVLAVMGVFAPRASAELERLRTEAAYRESQRTLSTLMSNLPGMAYRCRNERDWRMEFVSEGCRELTGYSSSDLQDNRRISYADVIIPEDREQVWNGVQAGLEQRKPFELLYRIKTADGSLKWVWEQGRGVYAANGDVVAVEGFVTDITDQKKARTALLESRQMLQLVLDAIPVRVFWKDRESVYLGCNRRFATDAGLESPEQIVGRNDLELHWREEAERYRGDDREVIESGVPKINYEEPQTSPEGTKLWLRTSKIPLRNPQDEIIGVLGCYEDITERKLEHEALRESEERFRSAFGHANTGNSMVDQELKFLQVNRFLCDMLGYTEAELLSMSVADVTLPEDLESTRHLVGRMMDGELSSAELDKRYLHKSGRIVWGHVNVSLVRNREGLPLHLLAQIQDITEHKQAEASAASERRFSESLIETAPAFIVGIDLGGNTSFMNQAMLKATGYELNDVIGCNYGAMFLTDDEREGVEAVFKTLLTGKSATHTENHILTRDGRELLVAWHGNAIYDPDGNVTAMYGMGEDITTRRRLEEQLRQSQKMESVGTLAGGIAHDFNNLLTVILGNVSYVLGKIDDDSPIRQSLQDVEKAGERAGALIQRILAFSRKTVLQIRPTDLQKCIDETVALLRRSIDPKIQIRVRSHPGLGSIRADQNQMNQVIMNLCLNARDAMPDGGPLTIEARNKSLTRRETQNNKDAREGEFVEMIVTDAGCGMDSKTQSRIFEPFFTTKEGGEGTGLGLAMVYGIVSQHDGWIKVRSVAGRGTSFHLFFPRDHSVSPAPPAEEPADSPRGTETVLLVDDEALVLEMSTRVLTGCGYQVLVASDGDEAVKVYRKNRDRIDLVILDFTLPKKHGFEVLDAIREINPEARIIFCTGQGVRMQQLSRGRSFSKIPMINKPVTAERLAQVVRRTLDA